MAGSGAHGDVTGQPFPSRESPEAILHRLQEAVALPGSLAAPFAAAVVRVEQGELLDGAEALAEVAESLDQAGSTDQAALVNRAVGDLLVAAGEPVRAAHAYLRLYLHARASGHEAARREAAALLVAACPPLPEHALGLDARPPADPAAAGQWFDQGMAAADRGDMQAALSAFRHAASLDPTHHAALFCFAVAMARVNATTGVPLHEGGPPVTAVGVPTYALLALDAAASQRAAAGPPDPEVQAFCARLAHDHRDAVWAGCDEQSENDAPWIALGLMSEYLGDPEQARGHLDRAHQFLAYGDRAAMVLRALDRLSRPPAAEPPPAQTLGTETPATEGPLPSGARVLANWEGYGVYYPGRVTGHGSEGYTVAFDDGDRGTVPDAQVRREDVAPGQRARVDLEGNQRYRYGTVTGRAGEEMRVRMDDTGQEVRVPLGRVGVPGTGYPPIQAGPSRRLLYPVRDREAGQRLYESALDEAEADDLPETVRLLEHAAEEWPSREVFYTLGCYLQQLGRLDEAREAYLDCLRLDPAHADCLANLAHVCVELRLSDDACRCILAAMDCIREMALPHLAAAVILASAHRWQEALAHADRALKLRPTVLPAYAVRQQVVSHLPEDQRPREQVPAPTPYDLGRIRDDLVQGLPCPCWHETPHGPRCAADRRVPGAAVDAANPGKCLRPRYSQCPYLRRALMSMATMGGVPHVERLIGLARQARDEGRYQEALEYYERAADAEPVLEGAYVGVAGECRRLGNPREAYQAAVWCADLARALGAATEAGASLAAWMLGASAADMDELETAVSHFQAACRLDPRDPNNWDGLAMAYRRLGEHRQAAQALQQAVAQGAADADIHYKLGIELAWLGDLEEADKHARQATALAPDDQQHAYHGELEKWLNDARADEETAREFLRTNPQAREDPSALRDPDLQLLAVHSFSVLRDRANADRALACLRERFPNSPEAALAQALVTAAFRNNEAQLRQAVEQLESIAASAGLSEHWQMIVSTRLSHHYYLLGDVERARQIVEAWLRKHPRDEGMWVFLSQICQVLGRPYDYAALRKALGLDRMPDTGGVVLKLGVVPLLVLAPLILLPIQLFVRILLVLGAVGALAYFLPGWVQGPSCTLRNERGAVIAAIMAGVGALLISGSVLARSVFFCCLDPLLWAAFGVAPALYYLFRNDSARGPGR